MLKIRFENIPCEAAISVFDNENHSSAEHHKIAEGDSEWDVDIPHAWKSPYFSIAAGAMYSIPNSRSPISTPNQDLMFSGADFYLDVNPQPADEEQNWKSVEGLIATVAYNKEMQMSGRQRFYVCLVSLQSYFEYVVHGMLVLSQHLTKTKFDQIETHEDRTEVAFSDDNIDFFSTEIKIDPRHEGLGNVIEPEVRAEIKRIFVAIRTLRNNVVHGWGYKDVGREKLTATFQEIGEQFAWHTPDDDDAFYMDAANLLVRLYARANVIKMQLNYFIARKVVHDERAARGY